LPGHLLFTHIPHHVIDGSSVDQISTDNDGEHQSSAVINLNIDQAFNELTEFVTNEYIIVLIKHF